MPEFDNIKSLFDYIETSINESKEAIGDSIKKKYLEHIQRDVYDVYSPVDEIGYERRGENDGLKDPNNIIIKYESNTNEIIIDVINIAEPNESIYGIPYSGTGSSAFAEWIENGLVPNIFKAQDAPWQHERPFTQNTIKDLMQNKDHIKALKKYLSSKGIDSK